MKRFSCNRERETGRSLALLKPEILEAEVELTRLSGMLGKIGL